MSIDDIDRLIVTALQHDARTPYAELARQVGLTAPAVTERIRKLESTGVVRGYHAEVDLARAGRPLVALIRISASHDQNAGTHLVAFARTAPDILEFHRTAGSEDYVARAAVASVESLEQLVVALSEFGQVTTSIILSSPVSWREVIF